MFGVSTFAWLAAWLSNASRIFMPVSGLFNPMQYGPVDLLPFDDSRFRFYLFPINYAVPIARHAALHQRIAPLWRQVSAEMLRRMFSEAPRFDPPIEVMKEYFDHVYYVRVNADVAKVCGPDDLTRIRHHYRSYGIFERRLPFDVDTGWYAARYPQAAMAVAQGDFSTFAHHYVAVGRSRGMRARPEAGETW